MPLSDSSKFLCQAPGEIYLPLPLRLHPPIMPPGDLPPAHASVMLTLATSLMAPKCPKRPSGEPPADPVTTPEIALPSLGHLSVDPSAPRYLPRTPRIPQGILKIATKTPIDPNALSDSSTCWNYIQNQVLCIPQVYQSSPN